MNMTNSAIGILVVFFIAAIFIPAGMNSMLSANTTGWNPQIVSMSTNYLPLVVVAVVMMIALMSVVRKGK